MTAFLPTPTPFAESRRFSDKDGAYELSIWDTAGASEWMSVNSSIYHATQVIVYVAAYDDRASLTELMEQWVPQLSNHLDLESCVRILAVNKCDLINTPEAALSKEDVIDLQSELRAECFDVSAKENRNIEALFQFAADQARKRFPPDHREMVANPIHISHRKPRPMCC
jgi:small GTP-binding protein